MTHTHHQLSAPVREYRSKAHSGTRDQHLFTPTPTVGVPIYLFTLSRTYLRCFSAKIQTADRSQATLAVLLVSIQQLPVIHRKPCVDERERGPREASGLMIGPRLVPPRHQRGPRPRPQREASVFYVLPFVCFALVRV